MRTHIFIILQVCLVVAYAVSFTSPAYQAQTAQQKMDQLWQEITANQTPYGWYSAFSLATIFLENVKTTFDLYSDVMPEGRKKLIHSVGAVAQAELIPEADQPYTGVFQGASNVLVRISAAKEPNPKKPALDNFTPGMGIKILRDNVPSANIVAMLGVEGNDSWNAFKYDWSNHLPHAKSFGLKLLAKKFAEATPYVGRIGVKTWGQYDENGQHVSDSEVKVPYKLIFRPSSETRNMFPEAYSDTFNNQLKSIPVGTVLHDIFAIEKPGDEPVKIGTLRTKTEFVSSQFGDKSLFFQHNYTEDDIQLHPNWEEAIKQNPPILADVMRQIHRT